MEKNNLYITIEAKGNKGHCCITHDDEEYIIHSLHVHDKYKHNGIGTSLMKDAEKIAKKLGAKKVYLFVHPDIWQHNWYTRIGYYDTMAETVGYFVKMKKILK